MLGFTEAARFRKLVFEWLSHIPFSKLPGVEQMVPPLTTVCI